MTSMLLLLRASPILLLSVLLLLLLLLQGSSPSTFGVAAAANPTKSITTRRRHRPRNNVLILLTDDQDLLITGLDKMPILQNHLQHHGVTFENAFVHTPVCCPSRSSILSGQYLHNNGVKNNSLEGNCYGHLWRDETESRSTIAVHAKKAGYETYYAGKYLNRYGEDASIGCQVPPGWDKWFGLVGNSVYYNYTLVHSDDGGNTIDLIEHGDNHSIDYLPDVLINQTLNWIDQHHNLQQQEDNDGVMEDDKPFLMVLSWPTPHDPFTPGDWARDLFPGVATFDHPPNFNASYDKMQQKHWLLRQLPPLNQSHVHFIHHIYRLRLRSLQSVDQHIGMLMKHLEKHRALNETYVFYTSDNGYQLGQHRMALDKRHLYEHDVRVPFIVRGPPNVVGRKKNITSHDIVLNIDIASTVYDIMHDEGNKQRKPIPNDMDGISILPLLHDEPAQLPSYQHRRRRRRRRQDFLISYHGESHGPCGLANCPMPPPPWYMPDAINNTYHCLRTIISRDDNVQQENGAATQEDSIYCRFHDDESFVEYYDLQSNKYQLDNQYSKLNPIQRQRYEQRLQDLLSCRGESCRQ